MMASLSLKLEFLHLRCVCCSRPCCLEYTGLNTSSAGEEAHFSESQLCMFIIRIQVFAQHEHSNFSFRMATAFILR